MRASIWTLILLLLCLPCAQGAVSRSKSKVIASSSAEFVADGADLAAITVKLRDRHNHPVPYKKVFITVSGSDNTITQESAKANRRGVVRATLASTTAELKTVTVKVRSNGQLITLKKQPVIRFIGDASNVDALLSTVTASPAVVVADGIQISTVTVTVRDGYGNPVPGRVVLLAATGSGNILAQPGATTDGDGAASGLLRSILAETKVVSATIDPSGSAILLAQAPSVTFVGDPGSIDSALSTAVATPATGVIADGIQTSTVSVTVRDAFGNPVPGQLVLLAASGTSNTLTQPGSLTDAAGSASGTLASIKAETKSLTVTVNPAAAAVILAQTPTVRFTGDPSDLSSSLSTVVAQPSTGVPANGADVSVISVTVRDQNGNPVAGRLVQLAATGSGNILGQPELPTNDDGVAVGRLRSIVAGTKDLTATIDPAGSAMVVDQAPSVTFVGDPNTIDPTLSTAVATPATDVIADGAQVSTVSVTVRDAFGNPVPGQIVRLVSSGTGNTLTQPGPPTDAAGTTSGTLASIKSEIKTVIVTVNPDTSAVTLVQMPTVQFTGDPANVSSTLSTVLAQPSTNVLADGLDSSAISVTVRDLNGNPVAGQLVQLAATGSGNVLVQPGAPTDNSGAAPGALRSIVAELKTITAIVNPGPGQVALNQAPAVEFVADSGSISATLSTLTASPQSGVIADGLELVTVVVTVRDGFGNPVQGQAVQLSATGGNNTLTQPGSSGSAGVATGSLASTTAEDKTVAAVVNPGPNAVTLAQDATVGFVADPFHLSPTLTSVSANPTANVVADGAQSSTITVVVRDAFGNPVPGQVVLFALTGTGNTVVQPGAPSDASGQATGVVASTTAELKTLSVTVNPGPDPMFPVQTPTIEFVADASNLSASLSTVSAAPDADLRADGLEASTVSVVVVDVHGNPVAGLSVALAATGGGNSLTQPAAPTDASGLASGALRSTEAGQKILTATVEPGPGQTVLTQSPTVSFLTPPENVSATLSSAIATPATGVVADGLAVSTVTVTVRDNDGNPAVGQAVVFAASGSANTLTQPAVKTDSSGVVTGTIASTTAELKTVTVTVNPGTTDALVLTDTPTVEFVGDASTISAARSSATAVPSTPIVADGASVATFLVFVRDANWNPVVGQTISLSATGSGNTLTQPSASTDSEGLAIGWLSSTVAETKTVTVTVNPGAGQVILDDAPLVVFVGDPDNISASLSSLTALPASGLLADGTDSSIVTVTVRDVNGNVLTQQSVTFAATGLGNTLTQPGSSTDANGVATGSLASTRAGTKTLTATVDPTGSAVVLADQPGVRFVWPLPNTFYVRKTGVDPVGCSAGTSPASAWKTLAKAASCVGAGATVYVGAGTYQEQLVLSTSGTASDRIRFIADSSGAFAGDPGDVIVDGLGANQTIYVSGADYLTLTGFKVTGSASTTTPSGGIRVSGSEVILTDNSVYGNPNGIYVHDTSNLTLERNTVSNNLAGGGNGIVVDNADGVSLRNNLVYNNASAGVAVRQSSLNLVVQANSFYLNGGDQIGVDGSGNGVTVRDNLVTNGAAGGIVLSAGSTLASDHNDSFGNSGGNWVGLAAGTGDISLDPFLVDPDGPDGLLGGANAADDQLHLGVSPASPALDAGSADSDTIVLSDGSGLDQRTSRLDGLLDGESPDLSAVNLGFHYSPTLSAPPGLAIGDGRLSYGESGRLQPRLRTWQAVGASWSGQGLAPPAETSIRFVVHAQDSSGDEPEEIICVQADTGSGAELHVLRWSGLEWGSDWSSSSIAAINADKQGFDVEYGSQSGQALVVYSNNSSTPVYRTRVSGVWSTELALPLNDGVGPNPDPNTGVVLWVELVPRPGTDEIALLYCDDNDDLVAISWDGGQWLGASALTLETNVKTNPLSNEVQNRAFDAAFESLSGDLVVAWSRRTTSGFWWSERPAGSGSWSAAAAVSSAPGSGTPHFVDLAGEPGGDRIAGAFFDLGDGVERLGLSTWTGAAWSNSAEYDSQIRNVNDSGTSDFVGAVGWLGTSGTAVCVYPDNQTGTIDWATWQSAGGWQIQSDISVSGKGYTESVLVETLEGSNAILAVLSDSNSDLYTAIYDGTWTVYAGNPLETGLSSIAGRPFGLVLRRQ